MHPRPELRRLLWVRAGFCEEQVGKEWELLENKGEKGIFEKAEERSVGRSSCSVSTLIHVSSFSFLDSFPRHSKIVYASLRKRRFYIIYFQFAKCENSSSSSWRRRLGSPYLMLERSGTLSSKQLYLRLQYVPGMDTDDIFRGKSIYTFIGCLSLWREIVIVYVAVVISASESLSGHVT